MDFETPEADAMEQQQLDTAGTEEDPAETEQGDSPADVNPADLAEQRTIVPEDDGYDYD